MKPSHEERFGHANVARTGRSDCAVCHRQRELARGRHRGAVDKRDPEYHVRQFGHHFEARKGNGCKVCHRLRENDWRLKNIDESRSRARDYARRHPAEAKQRLRKWKHDNKERARKYFRGAARLIPAEVKRERKRRAYHNNLEHYRAYGRSSQIRRHGSKQAADYAEFVRQDPCCYCGSRGGEADHVQPLANGGAHDPENLTGACKSCNSSKGDMALLTFLLYRSATA